MIALGLGHESLRKIPVDDEFRHAPRRARATRSPRTARAGVLPIAVVATVGTTSTTSVDPVAAIADICEARALWLHVDAAYAGVAAMVPSHAHILDGAERADSLVVNPHKWLFTPFDLSAFYCRRMDVVRAAFSLTPEYLKTTGSGRGVRNLMDTGIQLGRRFRALKLWMILRSLRRARAPRGIWPSTCGSRRHFASWVDAHPDFERVAPVPFSVVCFRWRPAGRSLPDPDPNAANERLLDAVNATGEVFLSHTRLHDRVTLRIAIGHLRTSARHVRRAWELLQAHAASLNNNS